MISKRNKENILTALAWVVISCSLSAVGMHFVSCSRDISSIVQTQRDEELNQVIAAQSSVPPVSNQPTIQQRKNKDSVLTQNRPTVMPCGVDSGRASKNAGGFIFLHCGGEDVGSLQVKPNSIASDTIIQIKSYSLAVLGLDVREYNFSPDGLQFSKKSELKLSGNLFQKWDGSPAQEILWLYLNPNTNRWELQNVITKSGDGYFHIELSHFSIYRAATKNSAGVSQGGQVKPHSK